MSRKRKLTPEEERLWRLAMKDTEPLGTLLGDAPATPPAKPLKSIKANQPPVKKKRPDPAPSTHAPKPSPRKQELPLHHLDRRSTQQVRRGQVHVDGKLDLHGMRQHQAHEALNSYVSSAQRSGKRIILVVTGKGQEARSDHPWGRDEDSFTTRGGGVLQSQVPQWLAQAPLRQMIFSVQQAHPHHGGSGALYVFLKKA